MKQHKENLEERTAITERELNEIQSRCELTKKGPWKSYIESRDKFVGDSFIMTGEEDLYLINAKLEDYEFIAHAKQDIPMLLGEIERLKILLKKISKNS